ncbi:MAG: signal peptide peptidase SppA [Tepidisphaeraceae bacterium]
MSRFVLPLLALFFLLVGCGTPSLLITPVANTQRLEAVEVEPGDGWFPKKIAIIEVEGMLLNARTGGFLQPQENKVSLFVEQLDVAARDPNVKAVVLRVNSPGGTVTASDTMYQKVVDFKKKTGKPVVASLQDVAASGGYYVATGADQIVAHPMSVVGSIGVIYHTFNIEGTLRKIGAEAKSITSGPFKDMGSPFKALSDDERAIMQRMVDEYYGRFVGMVVSQRPGVAAEAARQKIATDGRVFTGEQAVKVGLVDRTGLHEDAIDTARALAKAPGASVILYKRPYGYSGSIYASTEATPQPQANVLHLSLPGARELLPTGFYYLWEP